MSRENKKSLVAQVKDALDAQLEIGGSRYKDKLDGGTRGKIYSWDTYRNYLKHACYFVRWCKETHRCRTLEQCRTYVDEWLASHIDKKSAYTLKLEAAALAKLYHCSTKDFIPLPERHRSGITRSRADTPYQRHYSIENNSDLIAVCRATGLRRRELEHLRKDWLIFQNGQPVICVRSGAKGGRYREVPLLGTEKEKQRVVEIIQGAPDDPVFPHINRSIPIHALRAEAATRLYNQNARPLSEFRHERLLMKGHTIIETYQSASGRADTRRFAKYYHWDAKTGKRKLNPGYRDVSSVVQCRDDLCGVRLDRKACLLVSAFLGHNRDSIFPEHYYRP